MTPLHHAFARRAGLLALLLLNAGACGAADAYRQATEASAAARIDSRFFGIHAGYLVPVDGRRGGRATRWPDLPVGSFRLWDAQVRWAELQPARGQWQWTRLDALVDKVSGHGAELLYTLGSTPRWASARPDESCPYGQGCAAEPADMADWEAYVRAVARRYKGRIRVYEVWNEPKFQDRGGPRPRGFYSGTVDDMVTMARIARRVIREEDPQARLATPGFDGGPRWLEAFLAAGGRDLVDIVAYHFYARGDEDFVAQVVAVRGAMKRQGVEQLPLWNTESGFEADDGRPLAAGQARRPGRADSAALLAQTLVLAAAAGIERFYAYAWDHPLMGMVDEDGQALPNLQAYARVQAWLMGATVGPCRQPQPGVVACEGSKAGERFTIAWADGPPRDWRAAAPATGQRLRSQQAALAAEASAPAADNQTSPILQLGHEPVLLRWSAS